MSTGSGSPHLIGAGLDTSEGRSFVRERLALFASTIALLALVFYVVLFSLNVGLGLAPPLAQLTHPGSVAHLGAILVLAALWLALRREASSLRALGVLDAVALIASCWLWALMTEPHFETTLNVLLASTVTVVARAVIVPSSPRRTLVLTLVALAPALALSLVFAPPIVTPAGPLPRATARLLVGVNVALWIGAATAVAAVASSVIYGLRRRVREATELGAYTLEAKIGSGGMGEVWRAHHRLLIRPAAVKLIRPETLGASADSPDVLRRRFEREARATANLRCPHTVELYDFGIADDGALYYVMELLEGFNLDQLVTRFGPQPAERAVHILHQVCCSLAEAHRNGLIHRDVKPANVFVTRLNMAADFVKVVDFGLVKVVRPAERGDIGLTAAGQTTGTPAFMAPEATLGSGHTDPRADLYSLGCVAYWLLTGKLVFEGNSLAVLVAHARTPPPRPSTRCELPIPAALEALVLECLEKDPARRPASASIIAERLERIALPARWTQERAERWWRTHAPDVCEPPTVADLLIAHEAERPTASEARA